MNLRTAIIGAGAIAKHHLKGMAGVAAFRIEGICDVDPERSQAMAKEANAEAYTEWRSMLQDDFDAVSICVPHALHAEIAVSALESGCHVLVEKPMAVTFDECRVMIAAAQKAGRCLKVAETAVFAPGPLRVGELFASDRLGRFLTGRIQQMRPYFTPHRPRWFLDPALSGGGMFMNLGPHRLGIVRTCLHNLTPEWVDAQVVTLPKQPVEAFVSARLGYREGGVMQFEQIGHFAPPQRWRGDHYMVFEEAFIGFSGDSLEITWREGHQSDESHSPIEHVYKPVYEDWLRGIRGEQTHGPTAEDFAQDIAIIRAAYESGKCGQRINLI